MNSFEELIEISLQNNKAISNQLDPISSYLGASQFYYFKIKKDNSFTLLSSSPFWCEHYCSEKLHLVDPYFCHYTNYEKGIIILKDEESNCSSLRKIIDPVKKQLNFILMMVSKNSDSVEVNGFHFNNPSDLSLVITELSLLSYFAEEFKKSNSPLYSKLEDYQFKLPDLIGANFYKDPKKRTELLSKRKKALKALGIELTLSQREIDVLRLFLMGYSARKIALEIYLSKRTIEHHIERIKSKLNCLTKAELMQKARLLEKLNLLEEHYVFI